MFYRGRRLRNKKVPRNLIKENRLSVEQLISPIFVVAGNNIKKEISSLEGIYHYSIDRLNEIIKELQRAGINACILFGIPEHKGLKHTMMMESSKEQLEKSKKSLQKCM